MPQERKGFRRTLGSLASVPPLMFLRCSVIGAAFALFLCAISALLYLGDRTYGNIFSQPSLLSYVFGGSTGIGSDGAEYILAIFARSIIIFGFVWGLATLFLVARARPSLSNPAQPQMVADLDSSPGEPMKVQG